MSARRQSGRDPMDSMPLHVGDWLASSTVTLLGHAGGSIYLHLLMQQWRSEGDGLPVEPEQLRLLAHATAKEWKAAWPLLEKHFPIDEMNRRRNLRLQNERQYYVDRRTKKSDAGRKGMASRWNTDNRSDNRSDNRAITERLQADNPVPVPVPSSSSDEELRLSPSSSSAGLSAHFIDPAHLGAYLGARHSARNPDTFDAMLGSLADGMGARRGKSLTWHQIGTAILHINGQPAPPPLSANVIAGYATKVPLVPSSRSVVSDLPAGTVHDGVTVIWAPGAYDPAPSADVIAARGWRVAGATA